MRGPNLGLLALVVAAGGLLTGVFLALNYAPTLDAAHDSVTHIENTVLFGRFLRGLHHWAGTFAIVLAAVHGWRLFWHGAYKAPRQMLWVLGGLLLLVLVGFAYTGYLLPGDERAYTGMGVMSDVAGSTPVVGEAAGALTRGGAVLSSATMTRIYVMHIVLLPVALIVLVGAFLAVLRRVDPLPAGALARDAVAAATILVLLGLFAWLLPPDLGAKADPAGAGAPDAKPEWFLLWVNVLLRKVPGGTFLIAAALPGLLVTLALALPWLARGEKRDPAARKPEILTACAIVAVLAGLTAVSLASGEAKPVEEPPPPDAGASLDEQVAPILKRFKCGDCHIIDGGDGTQDPVDFTGPPLNRAEATKLYTREFFRRKVGNPLKFWSETQMVYSPRRLKPKQAQLDILERWFFEGAK